jgi:SAM-dependent methyltransferase
VRPAAERWTRVASAVARESDRGPLDLNLASYPRKWKILERLTNATAIAVLREANLFAATGEAHSLDQTMERGGIRANYRHLVKRWLERLVALGALRIDGERYVASGPLPATDAASSSWDEAQAAFSDNEPLFAYFRHCCGMAGKVLAGAESPLETLFPGGSFVLAEGLYERSATMRYVNALAAAALAALAATAPSSRPLRVLEVGAGTGATTASVLAVLPPDRTRYVFSDVSDVFLERGRERFAARGFVDFRRFDVDQDPDAQGFAPASFDVIVAANAVHASVDLGLALRRLRELLAPGGFVVLIESTTHLAWFDVTTGLIEGWQHFADDLRVDNPLLAQEAWDSALRAAGFEDAGAWPAPGSAAETLGQHLLVARAPGGLTATVSDGAGAIGAVSEISASGAPVPPEPGVRERVLAALPSERLAILRDLVRGRVTAILRLDKSRPPGNSDRLMDLGFDSLMAVQLRNSLSTSLGFERPLPATTMFDYPTIEALSRRLLDLIAPKVPSFAPAARAAEAAPVLGAAAVAAMSDDEIEAALLKRLERR